MFLAGVSAPVAATTDRIDERQYANSGADTDANLRAEWQSALLLNFGDVGIRECSGLSGL